MVKRKELVSYLNELLDIKNIDDVSNNGLQVEGSDEIQKIGLAVDASIATYEKAAKENCQMVIVHHGLIWQGLKYITGRNHLHIKSLMEKNINLYGVHLPLDKHPEIGNNIELSRMIGLVSPKAFGNYHGVDIGFSGSLPKPSRSEEIAKSFQEKLGGTFQIFNFGKEKNETVGIVSGGGADIIEEAIENEFDCFITGEGPHHIYNIAKEAKINLIYLGHYHSEQLGVQAIGQNLKDKFKLETVYLDDPPC